MARIPDIRRRGVISQVAPQGGRSGQAWGALADLAGMGAQAMKPMAT